MEERIRTIFQMVTDRLRFAEPTHGALLAANAFGIAASVG